jgi:Recombinase
MAGAHHRVWGCARACAGMVSEFLTVRTHARRLRRTRYCATGKPRRFAALFHRCASARTAVRCRFDSPPAATYIPRHVVAYPPDTFRLHSALPPVPRRASAVRHGLDSRDQARRLPHDGPRSGRFTYAQKVPEVVALVREMHGQRQSLRQIAKTLAAQGYLTGGGRPYTATAVQKMLRGVRSKIES